MKIKKNFFYDLLAKNISLFNNKKTKSENFRATTTFSPALNKRQ